MFKSLFNIHHYYTKSKKYFNFFNNLYSDLTALNDAGAIQGMEVREGDGIYITYTDGADTVIKKLVNGIIDLGTGTAFNISNRTSNYKNLTINDFIIEVNSFSVGSSSYYKGTGNCWPGGYFTLVKSYNAATGILTAYGHLKGGYSTSTSRCGRMGRKKQVLVMH